MQPENTSPLYPQGGISGLRNTNQNYSQVSLSWSKRSDSVLTNTTAKHEVQGIFKGHHYWKSNLKDNFIAAMSPERWPAKAKEAPSSY